MLQKRSFCRAIPIVLCGKGCGIAPRNDCFCHVKPIVLGWRGHDFVVKRPKKYG